MESMVEELIDEGDEMPQEDELDIMEVEVEEGSDIDDIFKQYLERMKSFEVRRSSDPKQSQNASRISALDPDLKYFSFDDDSISMDPSRVTAPYVPIEIDDNDPQQADEDHSYQSLEKEEEEDDKEEEEGDEEEEEEEDDDNREGELKYKRNEPKKEGQESKLKIETEENQLLEEREEVEEDFEDEDGEDMEGVEEEEEEGLEEDEEEDEDFEEDDFESETFIESVKGDQEHTTFEGSNDVLLQQHTTRDLQTEREKEKSKSVWRCWRVTSDFDGIRISRFLTHINPKLSFSTINTLIRKNSLRILRKIHVQNNINEISPLAPSKSRSKRKSSSLSSTSSSSLSSSSSSSSSVSNPSINSKETKNEKETESDMPVEGRELFPEDPEEEKEKEKEKEQKKLSILSRSRIDVQKSLKMSKKITSGTSRVYQFDLVLMREMIDPSTKDKTDVGSSLPAPKIPKAQRMEITKQMQQKARSWVIYKDDDIIAINKPARVPVQGEGIDIVSLLPYFLPPPKKSTEKTSKTRGKEETESNKHNRSDPESDDLSSSSSSSQLQSAAPAEKLYLVHRIDKETSGVMLLARNLKAARHISEQLRSRKLRKDYLAVVLKIPRPKTGRITLPLEKVPNSHRMRAVMQDYTISKREREKSLKKRSRSGKDETFDDDDDDDDEYDESGEDFVEFGSVKYGRNEGSERNEAERRGKIKSKGKKTPSKEGKLKFAVTDFAVCSNTQDLSLVHLRPQTGRAHQLRVHMASGLECPILGDPLYCKPDPIPPAFFVCFPLSLLTSLS